VVAKASGLVNNPGSNHDLNVIHYCGMAFTKLCVILFFFIPWLSIRMVLKKRKA